MNPRDVLIDRCKILNPTKAQRNSCARHLKRLTGVESGKVKAKILHGNLLFPIP
jgi:hypothetical protein